MVLDYLLSDSPDTHQDDQPRPLFFKRMGVGIQDSK